MQKFRVYFATKVLITTGWFRRQKSVSETEYVVVRAHNEAHAVKEAKALVDLDALGVPFQVTRIQPTGEDDPEGYHGSLAPGHVPGPDDAPAESSQS